MKLLLKTFFIGLTLLAIGSFRGKKEFKYPFQNPDLTIEERVNDLVSRMTLEEKIGQMMNAAPAIKRLDVPEYNWWNECLHGVARSGLATVFPQAIGLAAAIRRNDMRKLILRLAGLAFIALSLAALGGVAAPAVAGDCIEVICYGTNPANGECRQFSTPCAVPPGWTINFTGCAS